MKGGSRLERSSALNQIDDENDDGENEQDVNEAAQSVGADKA
jgi:hypothetical protein